MNDRTNIALRSAHGEDAAAIVKLLRASLDAFDWMPVLHTADEDLFFVRDILLPSQQVTVAIAEETIVGFIAVSSDWVEQLYLEPGWTGQGIGSLLLAHAISGMAVVKLHCFQANAGARRFYERHGFCAETFGDGSANKEGLPDILYVLRR